MGSLSIASIIVHTSFKLLNNRRDSYAVVTSSQLELSFLVGIIRLSALADTLIRYG